MTTTNDEGQWNDKSGWSHPAHSSEVRSVTPLAVTQPSINRVKVFIMCNEVRGSGEGSDRQGDRDGIFFLSTTNSLLLAEENYPPLSPHPVFPHMKFLIPQVQGEWRSE
jgi:hypothetical protein